MQRLFILLTIAVVLWPTGRAGGQRTGFTRLALNVVPESHLEPSGIAVRFAVSADGASDVASQTATVTARVRSLHNRQIHLTGRMQSLTGPPRTGPEAVIGWSGSNLRGTGGGQEARCTQGSFAIGVAQELVAGWQQSGTLSCAITFRLANARELPPGVYTASFDLATW